MDGGCLIAFWISPVSAGESQAVAQYQSGDPAAARLSLKAVLDYEPEHPAAHRMLEQIPP